MHIDFPDYSCSSCRNKYIPYQKNFSCPYCGTPSTKSYDLIPQIVASLNVHKTNYGRFTPSARYSGSIAERIQMIVFQIMDLLDHDMQQDPSLNEEQHLIALIESKLSSRNDKPTEDYVKDIILASYRLYKSKDIEPEIIDPENPLFDNETILR
ncbi:MAG: hypothetical protein WCJ45_00900 [bacterium]